MSPKIIEYINAWNLVHVDLLGAYFKSVKQNQPVGSINLKDIIIKLIEMIDHATVWFEIMQVPSFDHYEVTVVNKEYTDELSDRIRNLLNKKYYLHTHVPIKSFLTMDMNLK